MAFQDFDIIQERRRQERRRTLKKRLIIALVVLFVLGGIAAVAVVAFGSMKNNTNDSNKNENKGGKHHPPSTGSSPKTPSSAPATPATTQSAAFQLTSVCESSSYKSLCTDTVAKTTAQNPNAATDPKELVKSFITSTTEELDKAFAKAGTIRLNTEVEKRAFDVCKEVMENAKEELRSSFDGAGTIVPGKPQANGDLNNWLSAVMSYQETCIDSFPEGPLKLQFMTTFNSSEGHTSNSLALVSHLAGLTNLPQVQPAPKQVQPAPKQVPPDPKQVQPDPKAVQPDPKAAKPDPKAVQPDPKAAKPDPKLVKPDPKAVQPDPKAVQPDPKAVLPDPKAVKPDPKAVQPVPKQVPPDPKAVQPAPKLVQPAPKRRLLQTGFPLLAEDGLPEWMNHEERKLLKDEEGAMPKPNVIVAQDGTGKFKTINEALVAIPPKHQGRYVIFVKKGTYIETVIVAKHMVNLTIYGEGSQKTIITGAKNFVDGIPTYHTATFVAAGPGFIARSIGFINTAGPDKHQAVAARVSADKAIFINCRFEGFQDTLYAHTHRQYYRNCVIAGTIDFIFGDAAAVFQGCMIYVRKPSPNQKNIVTAQGRKDKFETTGIVLQNCKILPEEPFKPFTKQFKSYLGRPWKQYSRTIIMESQIEDFIDPAGWLEWEGNFALDTLFYGEFKNTGPGARTQGRVKWAGRKDITREEAMAYTVETFLQGTWVKEAGGPVRMGLGS
ncbi:hypothetical protein like AT2G26450 [Hibiscus trionum]|uniref:Pectinesterase inhibitor domain-containing protein n=1 Tax=Hibiscus trionum TaxID=183268 RepID=A0A9W7HPS8_HIBTR|nr:hypothetical protein like AT2G26450 [Hibiscus trionum]